MKSISVIVVLFSLGCIAAAESSMTVSGVHLSVCVSDLDKAKAFYQKVFACDPLYQLPKEKPTQYAWALLDNKGHAGVTLNVEKTSEKKICDNIWIVVPDIATLFAGFDQRGIDIASKPKKADDGHAIIGSIRDPDGNIINFAQ
jgi:predicted enzyme related to lactoylglutathione lyase